MARSRLLVRRELGIDVGGLSLAEADVHVAEAQVLREARIDDRAAGVARGIAAALGSN